MIVNTAISTGLFAAFALTTLAMLIWCFRSIGSRSLSRAVSLTLVMAAALALCLNVEVVDHYGSRMPFWDERGAEGWNLYRSFLDGHLSFADLFAAHNEHRIFTTRLSHLMLFIVNGQWDPKLEMACGAGIHVVSLLLAGLTLWNAVGRTRSAMFFVLLFITAAIPFGSFNLLSGFQAGFYFVQLFSLLAIIALTDASSGVAVVVALIAGLGAIYSLGSGLLAPLACLPVLIASKFLAVKFGEKRAIP